ncbi:zinc dependent phospholipase C family protein [Clostridium sp.]|uniref:zinc dependent phospholipase C family protein n=1 Tax=Clostridium sp. TaxID=1506 RepID=UPI002FC67D3C
MRNRIEHTYSNTMKVFLYMVNPIKKKVKRTDCLVHKFINLEALDILKNDGYYKEYEFFKKYAESLNKGVVWADSDFKSTNHFYHHEEGDGLYGFSNASAECVKYYKTAICYAKNQEYEKSLFFLGASCHLIQDATVPAHAKRKLRNHKGFESYVISEVTSGYKHKIKHGIIEFDKPEDFILENTKYAVTTEKKFQNLKNKEERFARITEKILLRANQTTAGYLLMFYKKIQNLYN